MSTTDFAISAASVERAYDPPVRSRSRLQDCAVLVGQDRQPLITRPGKDSQDIAERTCERFAVVDVGDSVTKKQDNNHQM